MLCCCCICWFCRKNSPGIALNFPQVSSRTPEVSMRKSIFLAGLSGAETLCRCETETVCLRGTETLCLWATKTCVCGQQRPVSLGNRVLCLCGTEKPCLCAEYRIWRGGSPPPCTPPGRWRIGRGGVAFIIGRGGSRPPAPPPLPRPSASCAARAPRRPSRVHHCPPTRPAGGLPGLPHPPGGEAG